MLFGSLHVCSVSKVAEQVIHLTRETGHQYICTRNTFEPGSDTFGRRQPSRHKYIWSDDSWWQKMLHKFTTSYREIKLGGFWHECASRFCPPFLGTCLEWKDIGFLILPHRSLYLVQFCLAIFRGPVILISVTVVKHGRTMIHLEKYLGCISAPGMLHQIQICLHRLFWDATHSQMRTIGQGCQRSSYLCLNADWDRRRT